MIDELINKAFIVCLFATMVAGSCTVIVGAVGLIIAVFREGVN